MSPICNKNLLFDNSSEHIYANLNNEFMEEPQILEYNPKLLGDPLLQHIAGMLVMIEQVLVGKL